MRVFHRCIFIDTPASSGGLGKTVTGAALARCDKVREKYERVVWLPLGQVRTSWSQ